MDTLSRYLRVEPMRNKNASATEKAFERMLKLGKKKIFPERVWVDDGKEFLGAFKNFCEANKNIVYQIHNEKKSAFAERSIRSLKSLIYKYMNESHTTKYGDQLPNFVKVINGRVNRVTGLAPNYVINKHTSYLVSLNLNGRLQKPKFKTGNTVRIRRKIETFHRGYKIQFSHKVFRITEVLTLEPPTYRIVSNDSNEEISGGFYESELRKMKSPASTFSVNLISNSSTETFLNNTLATFSNLLPRVINLNKSKGLRQVALLEISWPSNVENVTSGIVEINCAQNEETETDEEEDEEDAAKAGELEAPIQPAINKEVFVPISRRKRKPIWTRVDDEEPPPKKN